MRLARLLFVLVVLLGVWHWMPLKAGVVRGDSMSPAMENGQIFIIDLAYYATHPVACGDIVAFRHEGATYVKRVYAVAGETVWELRSTDAPTILLDEGAVPKVRKAARRYPGLGRPFGLRVPEGEVYVLGDAYATSLDSRHLGTIPVDEILGKVEL